MGESSPSSRGSTSITDYVSVGLRRTLKYSSHHLSVSSVVVSKMPPIKQPPSQVTWEFASITLRPAKSLSTCSLNSELLLFLTNFFLLYLLFLLSKCLCTTHCFTLHTLHTLTLLQLVWQEATVSNQGLNFQIKTELKWGTGVKPPLKPPEWQCAERYYGLMSSDSDNTLPTPVLKCYY